MVNFEGKTDLGYGRRFNEDYLYMKCLDDNNNKQDYLGMVLDGNGSNLGKNDDPDMKMMPATMVAHEIAEIIREIYKDDADLLWFNPLLVLKQAVLCANKILGGFKMGNEEEYGGFSSAITIFLIHDYTLYYLHAGNTRMYLMRLNKDNTTKFVQLTKDQTKAQILVDKGLIQGHEYYNNPDRLVLYSGIGVFSNPEFQSGRLPLQKNDILLFTTDGIHYALSQRDLENIIINNGNMTKAIDQMINDAIGFKNIDNMTALMLYINELD